MAEDKFAESMHLAQMGMFNLLENDVSANSQNDHCRHCKPIVFLDRADFSISHVRRRTLRVSQPVHGNHQGSRRNTTRKVILKKIN